MAINSKNNNWGSSKAINYLGKDFDDFRQNLINYTKTYFPTTYSDFNASSPGMMFIEMASYIGDVLSYYQDAQLKESMLYYATERKNVMALAQTMGYKPKITTPATTTLNVYQLVPSVYNSNGNTGTNYEPDSNYYLKIREGMQIKNNNGSITFRTVEGVDFSSSEGREITIYQREATTNIPELYLVTKKVKAISATLVETTVSLTDAAAEYPTILINDNNIIAIESVTDTSTNNKWYEVPYLAQETIFSEISNTNYNSSYSAYSGSVPYILQVKKVPNRFSTYVNSDYTITLQFGNGNSSQYDETVLPNTKNLGLGLASSVQRLNSNIDPSNFLKTNTFGTSPVGKTFLIKYLVGGGVQSNVNTGELTKISSVEFDEDLNTYTSPALYNLVKESVAAENIETASGGRGAESIDEIRQNAIAMFGSQNRAVTKQDYIVRALNMPPRYGSVSKVYVAPDSELDSNDMNNSLITTNPFAVNMYVLGYDSNKNLTECNVAVKQNLKTYLSEYKVLTDSVNILNGFIINIGVNFEIICYSTYNKSEVLATCLAQLIDFFNIDKWTFNKPINISEIELLLANVEGVMSVPKVEIVNIHKSDGTYSKYKYDIPNAIRGKIIYPSLDPSVFEVKYPNTDIRGRAL